VSEGPPPLAPPNRLMGDAMVSKGSKGSPVKSYDYLLKFLLVGDSDVGKGEILDSLQDGSAESPYAYSSGESRSCSYDDDEDDELLVLCHAR